MSNTLPAAIREKIARGLLPMQPPTKLWVRLGGGGSCDGCGLAVGTTDEEYEFEFPGGDIRRFHEHCAKVWHRVITGRSREPGTERGSGGAASVSAG